MYEPTRLAAACLEAAYARLVPTPWRRTRSATSLLAVSGVLSADPRVITPPTREVRHG